MPSVPAALLRCGYYVALGWFSKAYVDESAGLTSPNWQLARVAFAASVFDQLEVFSYVSF